MWGLAFYYEYAAVTANSGLFLLLHIIRIACFIIPAVTALVIMAVYNFLMRHPAQLLPAILFFVLCLLSVIAVIIPFCYEQLPLVNTLIEQYHAAPNTDTVLEHFLNKPGFIADLEADSRFLFHDMYAAYTAGYYEYLSFAGAVFLLICSFWGACTATKWHMLNAILLLIFIRVFFVLYPYTHHPVLTAMFDRLSSYTSYETFGLSLFFYTVGGFLHIRNIIALWIRQAMRRKRRSSL